MDKAVNHKRCASDSLVTNGVLPLDTEPLSKRPKPVSPPPTEPETPKPSLFYAGGNYQLKMMLLYLCRAHLNGRKVFLGQPALDGFVPGVDNFLLKYEDPNIERWRFRLVQSKHRLLDEFRAELTATDFVDQQGRASLQSSYALFQQLTTKGKWPDGSGLDEFVVLVEQSVPVDTLGACGVMLCKVEGHDPLFETAASGTNLTRYRIDKLPVHLQKQWGDMPGVRQLAMELVKCFLTGEKLTLSSNPLARFHYALMAENVLVSKGQRSTALHPSFLAQKFASPRTARLHAAMMVAVGEQDPTGASWPKAQRRAIGVSNSFGKRDTVSKLPDEDGPRTDLDEFCRKFVLAAGAPSKADLDKTVEAELGKMFNLIDGSVVFERLWAWLQAQMAADTGTTVGKELLDGVHSKLREWNLLGVMASTPLRTLGLEDSYDFFAGDLAVLAADMDRGTVVHVSTACPALAFVKVCQLLKRRADGDYAAVNMGRLLHLATYAIAAMKTRTSYCLVVEMAPLAVGDAPRATQVLRQLVYEALQGNGQRKVVLVAANQDAVVNKVLHGKPHATHVDSDAGFDAIDGCAKARLLDYHVTFQKQQVVLRDLAAGLGDVDFPARVVDDIVAGRPLTVGSPLVADELRGALPYYVQRRLQLHRSFDGECLAGDAVVMLTGMDWRRASKMVAERQLCRFEDGSWETAPPDVKLVLFDDVDTADANFEQLQTKFAGRLLQWIHFDGLFCVVKRPAGGYDNPDTRRPKKNRPVVKVITGAAGMGKSISLASLALREKKCKPLHWVLKADLAECGVADRQFTNVDAVIDFLCVATGLCERYERQLLEHCITQKGWVVLFLDGFDGIGALGRRNVLQALRLLKTTNVEAIWLTVRNGHWPELETELADYRYVLLPLVSDDCPAFLSRYWLARLKQTDATVDDEQVAATVKQFLALLDGVQLTEWLSNPLQAQMLTDVYWRDLQGAVDGNLRLSTAPPADLLELLERYADEKIHQGLDHDRIADVLGSIAVFSLFGDAARRHGLEEAAVDVANEEAILSLSLVGHRPDGMLRFVHGTVAEYFVARHLGGMLRRTDGADDTAIAFLRDVYFEESFDSIRPLLDGVLARGSPLRQAILRGDGDAVAAEAKGSSDAVDGLGRTPLHLAALHSPDDAFLRLVSAVDVDAGAPDHMGFVALCYALALVDRPPPHSDIPRHNLPILYLVQKASPDGIADILHQVMRIAERRRANREHIVRALTSLTGAEQLAGVADALDGEAIILRSGHRFDDVRYLLDLVSERHRAELLLADDCRLLHRAAADRTWTAFAWVAANLGGGPLRAVEDAVANLPELRLLFADLASRHDFAGLAAACRALTADVRRVLWSSVDFPGVFRAAVAADQVQLVADLLVLFGDDVAPLFAVVKCARFFRRLLQSPLRNGYFAWMFARVRHVGKRSAVLTAVGHANLFRQALVDNDRGVLAALADCTDPEKAAMRRTVPPADTHCAFLACLETRDNATLQLLLRFVGDDDHQKVLADLNVELDGAFGFDLRPDMDGLGISQICDDLAAFPTGDYDWSIWGHLFYALLRLQIRTDK